MKALLNYAKQHGRTYRDDQLAMVRYMLEHPDQVRARLHAHICAPFSFRQRLLRPRRFCRSGSPP
jgi:hypothetical protein